jgi:predicted dienelactone hydrolase
LGLVIITVLLLLVGPAHAAEQTMTMAHMSVTVWSQRSDREVKQPVILFSHGFHGCATQSRFLMEAFASAGYLVFAPDHRDATCHGGKGSRLDRPDVPFGKPEAWDETTFRDRGDDIRRLIDAIRADECFRRRADWSRFGLAGHSLGGYTVLGLAGAWPGWKLAGIRAVLALSPYTSPFVLRGTLAGMSAPVMYQGSTRDSGVTPMLHKSGGSYDQTSVPKYYVEFDKAGHLAWTDICGTAHAQIVSYSLAFMNHYVKGEPAGRLLTHPSPGVVQFRYASELGSGENK